MEAGSPFNHTCVVCHKTFHAAAYDWEPFIGHAHVVVPIGYQCQHCGAICCEKEKKKTLKFNIFRGWKKAVCPSCGNAYGPGTALLSEEGIAKVIVRDTEQVITALESDAQPSTGRLPQHEALLEQLAINGPVVVEHNLSRLNSRRSLASGTLDFTIIKWFGWLAEIEAYWLLHNNRIEQTLMEITKSKVRDERTLAAHALASIRQVTSSDKSIPVLLDMLEKGRSIKFGDSERIGYRESLFDALARNMDNPRVVDAFISYLAEDTVYIRVKAAQALRKVQEERVIAALIDALDDKEQPSKRDATSFSDMMSVEGPSVSEHAWESLKILTGQTFGPVSEDWKAWAKSL